MKGLDHDDRSPGDASRFCQHAGRLVGVGKHEEEKSGRERSRLERKDPVGDEGRRRSHDMDVAHIRCNHRESELPLQTGRKVSGPRAEVQYGAVGSAAMHSPAPSADRRAVP